MLCLLKFQSTLASLANAFWLPSHNKNSGQLPCKENFEKRMYGSLMPRTPPGTSGPSRQSIHSFNQTGWTLPAAADPQTPEFVEKDASHLITYPSFFYHMMWKQKKTKWTTFGARYHNINISCKTLWILILALPLYTLDIFCCIQQNWQVHSPIFHRHSHQAWLQVRSQGLTRFPHFGGTSYSLLFSSSFHDFCFPMFVHSSAFTYLALNLISSESLLATKFS